MCFINTQFKYPFDERMYETYMWCMFIKELYVDAVCPLCHFFFYKDGCFGKVLW